MGLNIFFSFELLFWFRFEKFSTSNFSIDESFSIINNLIFYFFDISLINSFFLYIFSEKELFIKYYYKFFWCNNFFFIILKKDKLFF